MLIRLLFLFTVVPAVELYLLLQIGSAIGAFETIWLIIITGIVGASMAKREGLSVIAKIQDDAVNGRAPGNRLVEGLMILVGGILLVTPGVLTDAFGLCMIFPLTRRLMVTPMKSWLANNVQWEGVTIGAPRAGPAAQRVQDGFAHPTPGEDDRGDPFDHPVQ